MLSKPIIIQVDLIGYRCGENKEAETSNEKTVAKENKK
jgi:hypothetical protein